MLALMWQGDLTIGQRAGVSLFHAVSAFCNAGFALQPDSLEGFRYAPMVHLVFVPLLVIGGVGFPVLENLWRICRHRWFDRPPVRWSNMTSHSLVDTKLHLHSKIVLSTTAILYLYGVMGICVAQLKPYTNDLFQQGITANPRTMAPLSVQQVGAVLADASFISLTSRTAGFHTVPMDTLEPASRFVIMTLMMIGASPGGTGGGMKTTTLALLLLTISATVRRRDHTEAFARQLSDGLVRKAATIAACFVALATGATLLLSLSEPYPFETLAFEAISAASTTGLSLGITGDLTAFGKAVIIGTMFLGRVGPLALLGILLFRDRPNRPYAYPHEDIAMG